MYLIRDERECIYPHASNQTLGALAKTCKAVAFEVRPFLRERKATLFWVYLCEISPRLLWTRDGLQCVGNLQGLHTGRVIAKGTLEKQLQGSRVQWVRVVATLDLTLDTVKTWRLATDCLLGSHPLLRDLEVVDVTKSYYGGAFVDRDAVQYQQIVPVVVTLRSSADVTVHLEGHLMLVSFTSPDVRTAWDAREGDSDVPFEFESHVNWDRMVVQ
jgi:hypothetical protein